MASCSLLLKRPVVVLGRSPHQVHLSTRDAAYRPVPVVPDTHVEVPGVEVLKVLVERHKVLRTDGEIGGKKTKSGREQC